jgi:hypothetical protein
MTLDTTITVAIITGILGPVLVLVIRYLLEKYKTKSDMITEALEISERVLTKIEHIRDEFHADRVWISQFHNGGHFYPTGKSIAKFSIVYETVQPETNSIQSSFQNIPVSLFSKPINHLLDADVIEIPDYKNETVATHGLKYVAEGAGCKSTYMFAIKTFEGRFIGILCLDFTRKKTKLDADSINQLYNYATSIGGVLISHLQKR